MEARNPFWLGYDPEGRDRSLGSGVGQGPVRVFGLLGVGDPLHPHSRRTAVVSVLSPGALTSSSLPESGSEGPRDGVSVEGVVDPRRQGGSTGHRVGIETRNGFSRTGPVVAGPLVLSRLGTGRRGWVRGRPRPVWHPGPDRHSPVGMNGRRQRTRVKSLLRKARTRRLHAPSQTLEWSRDAARGTATWTQYRPPTPLCPLTPPQWSPPDSFLSGSTLDPGRR